MDLTRDEFLGIIAPIVVYWSYSGFYMFLVSLDRFKKYRLNSAEDEDAKNMVSKTNVVKGVLLQQAIQSSAAFLLFAVTKDENATAGNVETSLVKMMRQFIIAMLVFDTYMYFMHRYMHINKFLYRHIHSWHHRLVIPYAFGSMYNHPLEGILSDTIGGALAFHLSGMSPRVAVYFFSFGAVKGIDDHCGMWLGCNVQQILFQNNTAYHEVHHTLYGSKYNFSQPFFTMWDKMFGTFMPCSVKKGVNGRLEVRLEGRNKTQNTQYYSLSKE